MTKIILLLWGSIFTCSWVQAQTDYDVSIAVDTTKMRIGEKIEYLLQVKADSSALVTFSDPPFFAPFEVLEESAIDTLRAESRYLFTKKYALIQFDSGAYWLPPQKVMINGFTKVSDSLLIQVATVPVDTLKQNLFDIKPIVEVEKNYDAITRNIVYGFLIVLLLIGLIYAFFFARKKREERKKKASPFRARHRRIKSLRECFTC